MTTQLVERIDRGDNSFEERPVEVARTPTQFGELARSARLVRTAGDILVVSTTFAALGSGIGRDFRLDAAAKLWISIHAYGRAPAIPNVLRLTLFLDGANAAGAGGFSMLENAQAGSLSISLLSDVLAAGLHNIELRGKVTGGTGTLFANGASAPLILSAMLLEGEAPAV